MQKTNRVSEDKDSFLQIVNKTAMIHKVIVHDYCLMDNHYHLLIETQTDNLAIFMRFISANYAQYFKNSVISFAYTEDGYTQIEIANFLGLSKSAISMIIKSDKSGD